MWHKPTNWCCIMGHGVWLMQMNSTQYQLSSMRRIPDRSSHHVEFMLLTACVHTVLSWKHERKLWVHMICCSSISVLSDSVYVCLLYIWVCATFKDGVLLLLLFLKMGSCCWPQPRVKLKPSYICYPSDNHGSMSSSGFLQERNWPCL